MEPDPQQRLRDTCAALVAAVNSNDPNTRALQDKAIVDGCLAQLLELAERYDSTAWDHLHALCYKNKVVVQLLVELGLVQLVEQVLTDSTAGCQTQVCALYLLSGVCAFSMEMHSHVLVSRVPTLLVEMCRFFSPNEDSESGEGSQLLNSPLLTHCMADAVAATAGPAVVTRVSCAVATLRNLCHNEANHAHLTAIGVPEVMHHIMHVSTTMPGTSRRVSHNGSPHRHSVGGSPRFASNGGCAPAAELSQADLPGPSDSGPLQGRASIDSGRPVSLGGLSDSCSLPLQMTLDGMARRNGSVTSTVAGASAAGAAAMGASALNHGAATTTAIVTHTSRRSSLDTLASWNVLPMSEQCISQRINAAMAVAILVGHDEDDALLEMDGELTHIILDVLEHACRKDPRYGLNWTVWKLVQAFANLAVCDANKTLLLEHGGVAVLGQCLLRRHAHMAAVQRYTTMCLWHLAFLDLGRAKLKARPDIVQAVKALVVDSKDAVTRDVAKGCLWTLGVTHDIKALHHFMHTAPVRTSSTTLEDEDVWLGRAAVQKLFAGQEEKKKQTHLMISYCWDSQPKVLLLKEELRKLGFRVWMDVEKMNGSTLEAMALAVEEADAVLVCYSRKYKESQACRTEAEYAFQMRKRIVPILMESDYRPTGWLGALLGTKLYFDCSDRSRIPLQVLLLERELGNIARAWPAPETAQSTGSVDVLPTCNSTGSRGVPRAVAQSRSAQQLDLHRPPSTSTSMQDMRPRVSSDRSAVGSRGRSESAQIPSDVGSNGKGRSRLVMLQAANKTNGSVGFSCDDSLQGSTTPRLGKHNHSPSLSLGLGRKGASASSLPDLAIDGNVTAAPLSAEHSEVVIKTVEGFQEALQQQQQRQQQQLLQQQQEHRQQQEQRQQHLQEAQQQQQREQEQQLQQHRHQHELQQQQQQEQQQQQHQRQNSVRFSFTSTEAPTLRSGPSGAGSRGELQGNRQDSGQFLDTGSISSVDSGDAVPALAVNKYLRASVLSHRLATVERWTKEQVADWLTSNARLPDLVPVLMTAGVDGRGLCGLMRLSKTGSLRACLVKDLGMQPVGQMLAFVEELHKLFD